MILDFDCLSRGFFVGAIFCEAVSAEIIFSESKESFDVSTTTYLFFLVLDILT